MQWWPPCRGACVPDKADLESKLCCLDELILTEWASGLTAVSVRRLQIEGDRLT